VPVGRSSRHALHCDRAARAGHRHRDYRDAQVFFHATDEDAVHGIEDAAGGKADDDLHGTVIEHALRRLRGNLRGTQQHEDDAARDRVVAPRLHLIVSSIVIPAPPSRDRR
jgi:hypothetical protein